MSSPYQIGLFNDKQKNPYLKTYKIYHDGSHYIAREKIRGRSGVRIRKVKSDFEILFDLIFEQAMQTGLSDRKKLSDYIVNSFKEDYCIDVPTLAEDVEKLLNKMFRNIWKREKRFRRKAFLNHWNYFVTFTYDGTKHTETTFIKKLRKCLSNLHNRRGWRYIGVSERGEEHGRFHYHFLLYVPDGQMVGKLCQRKDYSRKRGTVQKTISNDFFEKRFGKNDFQEIIMQVRGKGAVSYCLKYMRKTNARAIYSRGVPTELEIELDGKYAFAVELSNGKVIFFKKEYKSWVICDSFVKNIMLETSETSYYTSAVRLIS